MNGNSDESRVDLQLDVKIQDLEDLKLHFYIAVGIFSGIVLVIFGLIIWLIVVTKRMHREEKSKVPEFRISRAKIQPENPYRGLQVPENNRASGRNPLGNAIVAGGSFQSPVYVNELKKSRNFNAGGKPRDPYTPTGSDYFNKIHERSKFTY